MGGRRMARCRGKDADRERFALPHLFADEGNRRRGRGETGHRGENRARRSRVQISAGVREAGTNRRDERRQGACSCEERADVARLPVAHGRLSVRDESVVRARLDGRAAKGCRRRRRRNAAALRAGHVMEVFQRRTGRRGRRHRAGDGREDRGSPQARVLRSARHEGHHLPPDGRAAEAARVHVLHRDEQGLPPHAEVPPAPRAVRLARPLAVVRGGALLHAAGPSGILQDAGVWRRFARWTAHHAGAGHFGHSGRQADAAGRKDRLFARHVCRRRVVRA